MDVVSDAVGLDSRIGRTYLTGGLGFGGPCFPRDNVALAFLAGAPGARSDLPLAANALNRSLTMGLVQQLRARVSRDTTVAVLGVAYKPGSRPSPTLPLDTGPFPGVNWNHAAGPNQFQ